MTDYAKFDVRAVVSENTDYSDPMVDTRRQQETETPTKYLRATPILSTAAYTLDLSMFSAITALLVRNKSSTAAEVVDVTWYHQKGTQANPGGGGYVIADADPDTITDSAAGGTFVTNGATVGDYVRCISSEDAANDGYHLIQATTTDAITCGTGEALTANAADTAMTLSFERKNTQGVAAGGFLLVSDNVTPFGDLTLTSESGTPEVEVLVIGS